MSARTSISSIGAQNVQQNWVDCAKWLGDCKLLTELSYSRIRSNLFTIQELANLLRDGVILCNLINYLQPGSIDSSKIMKSRTQSRQACVRNIKLFLEACKNEFNLSEQSLFPADSVYDLHLDVVIGTLSTISKIKLVEQKCGRPGFTFIPTHDSDVYYNIQPIDEADQMYTPDEAILEDDNIYQSIIHSASIDNDTTNRRAQAVNLSKRDHVTREIYESEARFVKTLNNIINDFMTPLSVILASNNIDKKIIFINIEALRDLHSKLLENLIEAITGGHGRTGRICSVFDSYKQQMMKEYVDYFGGMQTAISKVDSLNVKNNEFKNKLEDCRKRSEMGTFKLSDLIRIPYQRVLKYHLLFNELNRQTDKGHNAKDVVQQTLSNMNDLAHYLNEAQRDKEILDQIDDIGNHLQDSNFNGTTLKDYGHLIKDDNVRIKEIGERSAKTRTLLLFDKALFICKSRNDYYYYKGTLLLSDYKIDDNSFDPNNNNNLTSISTSSSITSTSPVQLVLVSTKDHSKYYSLFFKDEKQKNEWKTTITNAIDKLFPRGYNQNGHNFILYNFERDIVNCSICKKVLPGVLFQGYKCHKCSSLAHKSCLLKFQQCSGSARSSIGATLTMNKILNNSNDAVITRKTFQPYRVRAIYEYKGRPLPPDNDAQILKLKPNDYIQVTDDDDDVWWKGFKVGTNVEGYFPKNCVELFKSYTNKDDLKSFDFSSISTVINSNEIKAIENFNWYSSCERDMADTILTRISNQPDKAIFLVRPRNEGGYAISIKFNGKVEHIRIHVLKFLSTDNKETSSVCLVEQVQFTSISELITYYMENRLEDNFPQLKTSLGIPFRDALPTPIGKAIALHDYDAKRMSTGVEINLKKDAQYSILNKETIGWWKVYNSDGLIGYVPGNYLQEI